MIMMHYCITATPPIEQKSLPHVLLFTGRFTGFCHTLTTVQLDASLFCNTDLDQSDAANKDINLSCVKTRITRDS